MKTKVLYFLLYLIAAALALPSMETFAQAPPSQYGNGIVNSAGQWAQTVGTAGARANRATADQLFQQALQHEKQGIATLNVGMLSQALTESQQGMKADDQARHFAQTSLQALKSGNAGGSVDLAGKYGTSENDLRDLANNSSPFLPAVQAKLDGYGIKVDHSAAVIKTPFGEFPLNATPEDIAQGLGKIANSLGYSANGISAGVQKALDSTNSVSQKAMADASNAAQQAGRNVASVGGAAGAAGATAEGKGLGKEKDGKEAADKPGLDPNAAKKFTASGLTAEQDLQARALALSKSREEMMKKFGMTAQSLGDQKQNLFAIVHERYQELRRQGTFNEYGQKFAALPR